MDDNSEVLRKWDGTGVKIYTAVNGNHGTWRGYSVNANMTADILEKQLAQFVGSVDKEKNGKIYKNKYRENSR